MPKRIPIAAVKRFAIEQGCKQVIVLAFDDEGRTHVATYGKSIVDCEQAAQGGNKFKRIMEWPEELCNTTPARLRKKTT